MESRTCNRPEWCDQLGFWCRESGRSQPPPQRPEPTSCRQVPDRGARLVNFKGCQKILRFRLAKNLDYLKNFKSLHSLHMMVPITFKLRLKIPKYIPKRDKFKSTKFLSHENFKFDRKFTKLHVLYALR